MFVGLVEKQIRVHFLSLQTILYSMDCSSVLAGCAPQNDRLSPAFCACQHGTYMYVLTSAYIRGDHVPSGIYYSF